MADLVNLAAESGRNIIGDDTTPTLELENTSTAPALKLKNSSTVPANASLYGALELVGQSTASSSMLRISGTQAFVSVSTIKFTTGAVAGTGVIRVTLPNGTFGWIPVMPDSAVAGIAV